MGFSLKHFNKILFSLPLNINILLAVNWLDGSMDGCEVHFNCCFAISDLGKDKKSLSMVSDYQTTDNAASRFMQKP